MTDLILDGSKLKYHPAEVAHFMANGRTLAPITIDMALTQACQYDCIYCYAKLQKNEPHRMTWQHLKRLLKDACKAGVKSIALQGDGESTLHPDCARFIRFGRYLGLDMGLATNGHAMRRDLADKVLGSLNWLQFNISAGDPENYARIMGVPSRYFHQVCTNIRYCVAKKRQDGLGTTILTQMVLMPAEAHQVLSYCKLARGLGVDWARVKHCSDNPKVAGGLGIDYSKYDKALRGILAEAEALATGKFKVAIKWSKINDGEKRSYDRCVGPQFLLQISGSGLVAPCGMLFAEQYRDFWLGNITETTLGKILVSDRYRKVMDRLDSVAFDPEKTCGTLCVQHDANKYLYDQRHPPANCRFV